MRNMLQRWENCFEKPTLCCRQPSWMQGLLFQKMYGIKDLRYFDTALDSSIDPLKTTVLQESTDGRVVFPQLVLTFRAT